MIRILTFVLLCAAGPALADGAFAPPLPVAQQAEKTVVTQLLVSATTATGQPITFPQGALEMTALRYLIPPGAELLVHKHPHPRFAYVVQGKLRVSTADDSKSTDYGPGDVVIEMVDAWHYGKTIGDETVELIVYDLAPVGQSNTVLQ